jgi:hypothetical protein
MTSMQVMDLIAGGEALAVEFKSEVNDTELVETVVCLAKRGAAGPCSSAWMTTAWSEERDRGTAKSRTRVASRRSSRTARGPRSACRRRSRKSRASRCSS